MLRAIENLKKLSPGAARQQGRRRTDRGRQLRRRPRHAGRLRPDHRSDRRAHGLEARPVQEGRAAHRAERDLRLQHLRPVDHGAVRRLRRRTEGAFLRRAFLQSAALHASGGTDPDRRDPPGDPRPAGRLPDHHARQGRGARQGHAELHRQPRRRLRHAGDHARSAKNSACRSMWSMT